MSSTHCLCPALMPSFSQVISRLSVQSTWNWHNIYLESCMWKLLDMNPFTATLVFASTSCVWRMSTSRSKLRRKSAPRIGYLVSAIVNIHETLVGGRGLTSWTFDRTLELLCCSPHATIFLFDVCSPISLEVLHSYRRLYQ